MASVRAQLPKTDHKPRNLLGPLVPQVRERVVVCWTQGYSINLAASSILRNPDWGMNQKEASQITVGSCASCIRDGGVILKL